MRTRPVLLAAAGALLLTVAAGGLLGRGADRDGAAAVAPAAGRGTAGGDSPAGAEVVTATIATSQRRLREVPGDYRTWAELGLAYVQQARITADPAYYPRAEAALGRSLRLNKAANSRAMAGQGSLANARHDFAGARDWARRALRLNAYDATAYAVLTDALTQLGDYPGATAAAQRALDLRPGVSAFTRASYDLEIHGRPDEAGAALRRALADATGPSDVAFCRYHLGELAWNAGRLTEAAEQYELGAAADPASVPLLEGRAKVAAARGRTEDALRWYAQLVTRAPVAQYLVQYGEYLESIGRPAEARAQFALVRAEQRLLAANGARDDLAVAQLAAEQGEPATAVRAARAEWGRRRSVLVADALGWALHVAGRDAEALGYARAANRLGWRNATFLYHLGAIEAALGRTAEARMHLALALRTNPFFSPVHAPRARQALARLGAAR